MTLFFAVMALVLSTVQPAAAQIARPAPKTGGVAPRTADGHPDFSGVWWLGIDVPVKTLKVNANPNFGTVVGVSPRPGSFASLYNPQAMAKWKTLSDKDDPGLRCVPVAFATMNVSLLGLGFVGQIIQSPKFMTFLTETYHSFKLIPTDGRPHRDDVAPSYRGDSVGRWEGDTFVVDTTNFADDNWLFAEGQVSFHSDALHIVERWRRVDAYRIEVDTVVEDPKVLTNPYKVPTQTLQLAEFDQIMELNCTNTETAGLMDAAAKQGYGKK
jgi:hypothetical protein